MRPGKFLEVERAASPQLLICIWCQFCFWFTSSSLSRGGCGQEGGGSFPSLWVCTTRRQCFILETPPVRSLGGCKSSFGFYHVSRFVWFALCLVINQDQTPADTDLVLPHQRAQIFSKPFVATASIERIILPHPCVIFSNSLPGSAFDVTYCTWWNTSQLCFSYQRHQSSVVPTI